MRVRISALWILLVIALQPTNAFADFFGGDLPLLTEIVINTAEQLTKLESIIGKSSETIELIKEINRGIRDALDIIKTGNNALSPGILSELERVEQVMAIVERLYGRIPKTQSAELQKTTDTSVAEGIQAHNEAFRYADRIDPEAERIKDYARDVNPLGAQKLTAQALGVLIHVMNQILRTNAAILKLQSEQLALQNRHDKLSSQQSKAQYEGLSKAFNDLRPTYKLNSISRRGGE